MHQQNYRICWELIFSYCFTMFSFLTLAIPDDWKNICFMLLLSESVIICKYKSVFCQVMVICVTILFCWAFLFERGWLFTIFWLNSAGLFFWQVLLGLCKNVIMKFLYVPFPWNSRWTLASLKLQMNSDKECHQTGLVLQEEGVVVNHIHTKVDIQFWHSSD